MNLQELLRTPDSERTIHWEDQFLTALSQSQIQLLMADPQQGPDSWPYLFVSTDPGATQEPFQKIVQWASTRGIGLAINPNKEYPDFILSYGMLWFFRETGKFIQRESDADKPKIESVEYSKSALKHAGTPTEKFLPPYVRTILKSFFRDQGVFAPRILMVSLDGKYYDLAFSADSLGNPPEQEWAGVAEAISWFLPPHYSVVITAEAELPPFSEL
jgi:hypothetical protein